MSESLKLIAIGLLMLALLIFVFWPVAVFANPREKTRLDVLMDRKDRLLGSLRELNLEYLAGKHLEEEFVTRRARLEREAEQLLLEIIDSQREET